MLARLQQCTTLGALGIAMLWALLLWRAGRPLAAVAGAVVLILGYALVLGIEFALLVRANRGDSAPAASATQVLQAWWGEVRSAPLVFCWRQPFRSRRWPDRIGSDGKGRRGVVFVHGFVCNRGLWNRWLARLTGASTPFVAVNLEPVFGSIEDYVTIIESAVRRIELATGRRPVVVAHSMGGLALRRWMVDGANEQRLHHAITLGSPHHGTWLARFAVSANGRQMRRDGPWLRDLAQREAGRGSRRLTCYFSHCDNIVFPASTATLPGADSRHLSAVAHVQMADHPAPMAELQRLLADEPVGADR